MRKPPDEPLLKALAAVMKERRNQLSLSQEELAHLADLNRTFVGKLELAQTQPSLTVLFALARALEVDIEKFVAKVASRAAKERRSVRP
ncbi:MAG: helix-turn-helix transcriptional regulator [Hydrogenophaga sp.]|uniref:helix-turn-helix domain-containing protein n=1 Tax=Hydrogenophaga sp. TaxID=1904254 RepID=UPI002717DF34|nr:helix-turn-helix transcriptional regulator [Hydrogenophaga sp.]MDO9506373.1 helix-turn-helix transcriptional regulator [Hydrogenophaga sp.]MDP3348236.1 helix-turn-helix transcriptional regulator [Hydrogenophaga sp.]